MTSSNVSEKFVWGSELEGRGVMTTFDTMVGVSIWALTISAVVIGILNLCVIKKLTIFHNSFGAFWVSRTIGEIGSNIVHVLYSAPVTVLQPKDIPPTFGVTIFMIGYFFASESCIMHQFVSANRMLAVCAPLKYDSLFNRKVTRNCIIFAWSAVTVLMSLYIVVPCQMIGYSPKYYEFIYIRCERSERETAVQNVTMMGTLAIISIVNNRNSAHIGWNIVAFDSIIVTHVNNGLALILFNPEVRRLFRGKSKTVTNSVEPFADQTTVCPPPQEA
ncbi:hypothetical protein QR680_003643 [Steinernema hermaphroditum]|uniref:7TM GPCR serpentine receptor class x (Srx) domain-containing protein n=1 Tax=Steinernema hermaphroditum TaxID=289476 RepID=A0AA39LSF1_9BILA|nr:hypothetical protein QR680_003643 [Steinernema hermaphroditum]